MNVFTAVVRIGSEPEQKFTGAGLSIVSFRAAFDTGYGEKKVTTWIRCTIFGKQGEGVFPYLLKGGQVAISGEMTNRPWQDKEGQERFSLEVDVGKLQLIGGKAGERKEPAAVADASFDDSIPF